MMVNETLPMSSSGGDPKFCSNSTAEMSKLQGGVILGHTGTTQMGTIRNSL
jgi:hypothetical protein